MRRRSDLTRAALAGAAAILALAAATPAPAQPRRNPPTSIAGAWRIETAPHHRSGCVIRGDAAITQAAANAYEVALNVEESCPDGDAFDADEHCRAIVSGARVAMSCVVVRAGDTGYIADSFALDMRGDDLMIGRLVDAGSWNEPVTWRRRAAAMVS